jgi:hypothetical protein
MQLHTRIIDGKTRALLIAGPDAAGYPDESFVALDSLAELAAEVRKQEIAGLDDDDRGAFTDWLMQQIEALRGNQQIVAYGGSVAGVYAKWNKSRARS